MHEEQNDEFATYLDRFERLVGEYQTGQYGRFKGRLVRKLDQAQYLAKLDEYLALGDRFLTMINSGDTIDDALALDLRAAEVELVLEKSRFFPFGATRQE